MRRALTLATLLAVLALPAAAQDAASHHAKARYAVDMTVVKAGAEIASGRTIILEGGQAEITLTGADGQYHFTADLQPEQGDGQDDRVILQAFLNHDGADLAAPTMILKRGGTAVMRTGSEGPDGAVTDGVAIELSPLPTS